MEKLLHEILSGVIGSAVASSPVLLFIVVVTIAIALLLYVVVKYVLMPFTTGRDTRALTAKLTQIDERLSVLSDKMASINSQLAHLYMSHDDKYPRREVGLSICTRVAELFPALLVDSMVQRMLRGKPLDEQTVEASARASLSSIHNFLTSYEGSPLDTVRSMLNDCGEQVINEFMKRVRCVDDLFNSTENQCSADVFVTLRDLASLHVNMVIEYLHGMYDLAASKRSGISN